MLTGPSLRLSVYEQDSQEAMEGSRSAKKEVI